MQLISLAYVLTMSVSADVSVAVVHTGEPGALDAARLVHQHLGGDASAKLYEPMIPAGCARDPSCAVRPVHDHLVVVGAASGPLQIHLELVDKNGVAAGAADVAVEDASLLSAALQPEVTRLVSAIPVTAASSTNALPPADATPNGWLIAGAVVGGSLVMIGGSIAFCFLGNAAAQAAETAVNDACGAACAGAVTTFCRLPTEACTSTIGSFSDACGTFTDACTTGGDACTSVGDSCSGVGDACTGIDAPSCDVPSPSCGSSCALPAGAAPLGMRGLERAPTEEAPPAGPMAY